MRRPDAQLQVLSNTTTGPVPEPSSLDGFCGAAGLVRRRLNWTVDR